MSNFIPESRIFESECAADSEGHCITCSDEALPARVLQFEQATGIALVVIADDTLEIDASLLEAVTPGDMVLVHGGVALAQLERSKVS